jgi:type IV pilus assembly protein PilV
MVHQMKQAGFSLLEVMIAIVIMGIGMLGIAALQTTSSVFTESAMHRGQAAALATEMVERMRANVTEAKAGNYNISSLPSLTENCIGPTKDCTPSQMKDHDLRVWSNRVASLLPSGTAAINSGPDNDTDPVDITVTLQWDDSRGRNSPVSEAFTFKLMGLNK